MKTLTIGVLIVAVVFIYIVLFSGGLEHYPGLAESIMSGIGYVMASVIPACFIFTAYRVAKNKSNETVKSFYFCTGLFLVEILWMSFLFLYGDTYLVLLPFIVLSPVALIALLFIAGHYLAKYIHQRRTPPQ